MEVCDSLWALAAFAGWILLGFAVYFIIAQRLEIERNEAHNAAIQAQVDHWVAAFNAQAAKLAKFDRDGDGFPGGSRKRHDPYIDR